jgi:hypothetical protein
VGPEGLEPEDVDAGHCSDASMLAFIQEKYKWIASRFNNLQPDLAVTRINQTDFLCGGT